MPVIEVNPALILRTQDEAQKATRRPEECVPESLSVGQIYPFLKRDQRIYWLKGEIPLIMKNEEGELSRPIASVQILEATHFTENGNLFTRGLFKVTEIFQDEEIHFEALDKVGPNNTSWKFKIKNFIGS